MARIFISYSRADEAFARRLAGDLSQWGADVWIDVEDIPAGMDWSNAIQQGLDSAEVMLVIVSPESAASPNVEDEWKYFKDQDKPLIPIMVRPAKLHFQLHRLQYIDFHAQSYDAALQQLRAELTRQGITVQPGRRSSAPRSVPAREEPTAAPPPPATINPPPTASRRATPRTHSRPVRLALFAVLLICGGMTVLFVVIPLLIQGDDGDNNSKGEQSQEQEPPFAEPEAEALLRCDEVDVRGLRIAYITDGGGDIDSPYYALPAAAAEAAAACGANLLTVHPRTEDDLFNVFEDTIDPEYPVVILAGGRWPEYLRDIAQKWPDTWFITIDLDYVEPLDNIVNITVHEDHAGFLAGALAAFVGSERVGGVFGSTENPRAVAYRAGFEAGVDHINPGIERINVHRPDLPEDPALIDALGQELAREILAEGASVLVAADSSTSTGALIATALQANEGGPPPYCIGTQWDRWLTLPDAHPCLINSVVYRYDIGVATALMQWTNGERASGNLYAPVTLAPFYAFEDRVEPGFVDELNGITEALMRGEIDTGYRE